MMIAFSQAPKWPECQCGKKSTIRVRASDGAFVSMSAHPAWTKFNRQFPTVGHWLDANPGRRVGWAMHIPERFQAGAMLPD